MRMSLKPKTPEDVMKVAKKIEKIEYVQSVKYGQGYVEKLFDFVNISRNIGIVLIVGLVFTAMFLISNTIKITITARRREIEIMRLVGATNSFHSLAIFPRRIMVRNLRFYYPNCAHCDSIFECI